MKLQLLYQTRIQNRSTVIDLSRCFLVSPSRRKKKVEEIYRFHKKNRDPLNFYHRPTHLTIFAFNRYILSEITIALEDNTNSKGALLTEKCTISSLDLSKTFDDVKLFVTLLLQKLKYYAIRGVTIKS